MKTSTFSKVVKSCQKLTLKDWCIPGKETHSVKE